MNIGYRIVFILCVSLALGVLASGGCTCERFERLVEYRGWYSFWGELVVLPGSVVELGMPLSAEYTPARHERLSVSIFYHWNKDDRPVSAPSTDPAFTPNEPGMYTVTISAERFNPKTSAPVRVRP